MIKKDKNNIRAADVLYLAGNAVAFANTCTIDWNIGFYVLAVQLLITAVFVARSGNDDPELS